MKAFGFSVLGSAFLFSLLWIAGRIYGFHSAPGIWLALVNLPGVLLVAWITNWIGFCGAIIVNSILYAGLFCVVRGIRSEQRVKERA